MPSSSYQLATRILQQRMIPREEIPGILESLAPSEMVVWIQVPGCTHPILRLTKKVLDRAGLEEVGLTHATHLPDPDPA